MDARPGCCRDTNERKGIHRLELSQWMPGRGAVATTCWDDTDYVN